MFREIRRKDRILDESSAWNLLRNNEYGFLAMCGANGYGYSVPLNYVLDNDRLYFHCAPEGFKLDSLAENNKVSFTVVGRTNVVPGKFTTEYESTLVFGKIEMDLPEEERRYALGLILDKYSPEFKKTGMVYIEQSFHRTNILRLNIEHISGKCRK